MGVENPFGSFFEKSPFDDIFPDSKVARERKEKEAQEKAAMDAEKIKNAEEASWVDVTKQSEKTESSEQREPKPTAPSSEAPAAEDPHST